MIIGISGLKIVNALARTKGVVVGMWVIVKREWERSTRLFPVEPPSWPPFNHQSVARSSSDNISAMP